jgi:hypothetical protein
MTEVKINSVYTRTAHMEQGFVPTDTWRALSTYDTSNVLLTTQNPEDFRRLDFLHKEEVTIVRQYTRQEETWIIEEPFPAPKTITQEEIILFLVNNLNVELEPWQEELIRVKFNDRSAKLELGTTRKS